MKAPTLGRLAVLDRLGAPGAIGLGLLLFCAVFAMSANVPMRDEVEDLRAQRDRLAATAQADRPRVAAEPVQRLPSFAQAPELLKQINALAEKNGVPVTRSSYEVKTEDSRRIFAVELPLKVSYPALRAWLRDVFASAPTARLDGLSLRRSQATDPVLDADVRLSFSFAAAS